MSDWKRPTSFETQVEEKLDELVDEGNFTTDHYDAFLGGALFAALIAEGRIES